MTGLVRSAALLLAFLALCLLVPAHTTRVAYAAPPALESQATVSPEEVTLGERVRLRLLVRHASDVVVSLQPLVRTSTLQVVEVVPPASSTAGEQTTTRFELVLAAFELGPVDLPPLRLAWLYADGENGETEVAPPRFTVRSTVAPDDRSVRPLKPVLDVAGGPPAWQGRAITAAAVAGAVMLAAGVAFTIRARRRLPSPLAMPFDHIPTIEEAARARLDTLADEAPLARQDYDTYYGTIAAVVRDYLQARFEFGARALTTPELQQRMVGRGVERWQARLVAGLLDRCDGAVYAGRRPDPASADHDLTVAFEIIELSRPADDAPEPAAPEPAGADAWGRR